MPVAILVTCSIKMPIPHEFSLNRPNVTEVGPPERTRQTVREGLNDLSEFSLQRIILKYNGTSLINGSYGFCQNRFVPR